MVWVTYINKSKSEIKDWLSFKSLPDVVIQSVNVMYDCHDPVVNGYEFHVLANAGVNIFNVDLTRHDQDFFESVKEAVELCASVEKDYRHTYNRPVAISVTISVKQPYELDDKVDIIILKDITKTEEFLEFRKQNKKFSSMPILIWPTNYDFHELDELIKRSAGIILQKSCLNAGLSEFLRVIKIAKEAFKPVFHIENDMLEDYHNDVSHAQARRLLSYTSSLVKYGIDGVIVQGCVGKPAESFTRGVVRATEIAMWAKTHQKDYFEQSFQLKIPILPPMTTAYGACLAALTCKAKAIIVLTTSGASARLVATTSPHCHIIAVTAHETTARALHLYKKKDARQGRREDPFMLSPVNGESVALPHSKLPVLRE